MSEEFREDSAFLAGVRSALEADAGIDAGGLAAIRFAALREREGRAPARTAVRNWRPAVLKAAASLLVAAGLALYCARPASRTDATPPAILAIAFVGEVDGDDFAAADVRDGGSGAERLLACQDAPYYEAVANLGDFGDNSVLEF